MKRSPFIAVVLGLVLALFIYTKSVRPKRPTIKNEISISDQIQEALSNIQNADNAQSQMKGILQMKSLSEKYPEMQTYNGIWVCFQFSPVNMKKRLLVLKRSLI